MITSTCQLLLVDHQIVGAFRSNEISKITVTLGRYASFFGCLVLETKHVECALRKAKLDIY